MGSNYPEHDKMAKIQEQAQTIGEFIENLGQLGLTLCDKEGDGFGRLFPTGRSLQEIIAAHFGIELKKIDQEKRQMLEEIQAQNEMRDRQREEEMGG